MENKKLFFLLLTTSLLLFFTVGIVSAIEVEGLVSEITLNPSHVGTGYVHEVMQINYARNADAFVDFELKNIDTGEIYLQSHNSKTANQNGYFEWSYRNDEGLTGTVEYPTTNDVWASDDTIVPAGTKILITITLTKEDGSGDFQTVTKEYTITEEDVANSDHNHSNDALLEEIILDSNFDNTNPIKWDLNGDSALDENDAYVHEVLRIVYGRNVIGNVDFELKNANTGKVYSQTTFHGGINPTGSFEWSYRDDSLAGTPEYPTLDDVWASDDTIVSAGTPILITIIMTQDDTGSAQTITKEYIVTSEDVIQADHDDTNNEVLGEITLNPDFDNTNPVVWEGINYVHEVLRIIYARNVAGTVEFTLENVDTGDIYSQTSFNGGINPTGSFEWSYRIDTLEGSEDYPTLDDVWASDDTIVSAGTKILITIIITPSDGIQYAITKEYTVTTENVFQADHDDTNNDVTLEEGKSWADSKNIEVDDSTDEIVVAPKSSLQDITIPSSVAEDKQISLDLSRLLSGSNITLDNQLNLKRQTNTINYNVEIPAGTIISGDGWDGKINLPSVKVASDYNAPSASSIDMVIDIGGGVALTFSQPVKVLLPGMTGKKAAYSTSGISLTTIDLQCNSATDSSNIVGNGECYFDDGTDLVIWTKHFTSFGAYTPSAPVTSSSGGGSGTCTTKWKCTEWESCVEGLQIRTCSYPLNYCSPSENKPVETQSCSVTENLNTNTNPEQEIPSQQTRGGITGAIIGAAESTGFLIVIIFIVVLGATAITVRFLKNKK